MYFGLDKGRTQMIKEVCEKKELITRFEDNQWSHTVS